MRTCSGRGRNNRNAIIARVYDSTSSNGASSFIELCTVSLPRCKERTPSFSLTSMLTSRFTLRLILHFPNKLAPFENFTHWHLLAPRSDHAIRGQKRRCVVPSRRRPVE